MIDGPAGAGKSTVARVVAERLGLPRLDTGAIYRTLALLARERGVSWDDEPGLLALADGLSIAFGSADASGHPTVSHAGRDVTAAIRTPEISQGASRVSALPGVRAALLPIQRALGAAGCVAEGRDMGTVVFPHAPHKFFLTASLSARASRRRDELRQTDTGAAPSVEDVAADLQVRDARDSTRAVAPLRPADDAVLVDTTDLDVDGVVAALLAHIAGHT